MRHQHINLLYRNGAHRTCVLFVAALLVGCRAMPADGRSADAASAAFPGTKPSENKMSASNSVQAGPLSTDIVPFITDEAARMIVAKIADVRWTKQTDVEIGSLKLEVLEVMHGDAPRPGELIEVPAQRKADLSARDRSNFDQWNVLALSPGDLLLMACASTHVPGIFQALAADPVNSVADSEVQAVRRAYIIEALAAEHKRPALEQAMESDQRVLRYYALSAIEKRGVLAPQTGAEAIAAAIASPRTAPEDKLELGVYLTHHVFFDKNRDADPTNRLVVATLSRAMLAEPETKRRLQWVRYLASVVLPERAPSPDTDRARRSALIRSSQAPIAEVAKALMDLAGHASGGEQAIVNELVAAFRAAATGTP